MGVVLILLGVLAAAVVADLVIETDFASEQYTLLGQSFSWSESQVLIGAAVLGAIAMLCVALGVVLSRAGWSRRRARRREIKDLERENEELRDRARTADEVEADHVRDVSASPDTSERTVVVRKNEREEQPASSER